MRLRTRLACTLMLLLLLTLASTADGQTASGPTTTIGMLIDGPGALNEGVRALVEEAILALTRGEFDVRLPQAKTIVSDWSLSSIRQDLDRLLADPDVDMLLAMGVIASYEASTYGPLPKPVIAPFVLNYGLDAVPLQAGASRVSNLSYLVLPRTFRRDVETFLSIIDFVEPRRLGLLFSEYVVTALPFIRENIEGVLDEMGLDYQAVLVGNRPENAVTSLEQDVDAVFVMPLIHLSAPEIEGIAEELIQRRLPSFSLLGRAGTELGLLASLNPDIFPQISRRIGLHVQRILLGDPPEELQVAFAAGERLTLNIGSAEAMNLPLRWATVTEADVVGEKPSTVGRMLTLLDVVSEALESNRELAAAAAQVEADAQDVSLARSEFFPQADIGASAALIDRDRAEGSFGLNPERTLIGSATLTQILYSEKAWANFRIQDKLQMSREADLQALRMDVIQEAINAYLNVLRAESLEQIQQENLKLTRSNLELAQVRELVGQSGPAEAIRLESQLATNISDAIEANAQRNVAEIQLNRILNRPLEDSFRTAEDGLEDVLTALTVDQVVYYFGSKPTFASFRDFLVERALVNSPELAALDRAIAAQERARQSAGRAFWLPSLALRGELDQLLDKGGAGSGSIPFDDTNWSLALGLSFPLFEGGAKAAVRRQAIDRLIQLQRQRDDVTTRIAQRSRSALHLAGSSYAGIEQAQRASDAAHRSLDIVVDAYAQGTVPILDLLEAQTRALVADEQEAAAVFDFFLDLMEVYRSMGAIEPMLDPAQRELFLQSADAYLESRGLLPRP